jgi:heavy metal translocating P-type ATPase
VSVAVVGLIGGLASRLWGNPEWSGFIWTAATIPVLAALLFEILHSLRRGEVGLDLVAALSMSFALAFGEALAAVVVALMYAGGQYLESYAEGRARRELTSLLNRVPRLALRHGTRGLEEVPVDAVEPGDRLVIRRGDVVPVDGVVAEGVAVLDDSALTGEPLPKRLRVGEPVLSGALNAAHAFDLAATARADQSTYAGIVRLVEEAHRSRAPITRLADRYAIWFLLLTLLVAGGAWLATGDPIRALSVLVVATPCPLILAVPVAIVSGISRAAKLGVLVKGGGALEMLARIRAIVVDKTGTLTYGAARYLCATLAPGWSEDEALRLAASLDQASRHVIAQALVAEARARGAMLATPARAVETPGEGLTGEVEGRAVAVGGYDFVLRHVGAGSDPLPPHRAPGAVAVAVAVDGRLVAVLVLADEVRAGTASLLEEFRRQGIERIVLATGDRLEVAHAVTAGLPIDAVHADLSPGEKSAVVRAEGRARPVMMIGDGVNDAPALAAADLGVAMGAKGAAASAEAADIVLLADRLDRILPAFLVAHRTRRIALQSVSVGLGLSFAGMVAAAFGHLTPVQGALVQEAIDVAVILNALRALQPAPRRGARDPGVRGTVLEAAM